MLGPGDRQGDSAPADGEAAVAECVDFSFGDAGRFQAVEEVFHLAKITQGLELPARILDEHRLFDRLAAQSVLGGIGRSHPVERIHRPGLE